MSHSGKLCGYFWFSLFSGNNHQGFLWETPCLPSLFCSLGGGDIKPDFKPSQCHYPLELVKWTDNYPSAVQPAFSALRYNHWDRDALFPLGLPRALVAVLQQLDNSLFEKEACTWKMGGRGLGTHSWQFHLCTWIQPCQDHSSMCTDLLAKVYKDFRLWKLWLRPEFTQIGFILR